MKPQLKCVMLIDDDSMTNFMNKIIIDEAEITKTIIRKYSGNSALAYLSDSVSNEYLPFPDLVFVDLEMPDGNGWDFIERYNVEKEIFPIIPIIIMLTTCKQSDTVVRAGATKEISALHFKPLTHEILSTIMINYFPNSFHQ